MLPGFKHRLMTELHDLMATPKYQSQLGISTFKFHSPPAKENCVAWLGGIAFLAVLCFLCNLLVLCITE